MKVSRVIAAVAAAALAVTVGACSSGPATDGATGQVVELTMWAREGDNAAADQMKAFNASQDRIKVSVTQVDGNQYLTKLANAVRSKNVPDLVNFDIINAPLLATQGQLLDITDRYQALPNKDSLVKAGVEVGSLDGRVYSLPYALTGSQMFWNTELFEKAGLDPDEPPTSLAEVKQYAEQIQKKVGGDVKGFSTIGGTGQAFTGFPSAWADGATLFTAPGPDQKATFTDPGLVSMVSWYQDMWSSGLMPATDEPNQDPSNLGVQNARSGKVGIVFTGATALSTVKDDFRSTAGIPGARGGLSTFVGGNQAGIMAGSEHPDEAWQALQWAVSDRQAAEINLKSGWIAPDSSLATELAGDDAWDKAIVEALPKGQLPVSIAYFAVINDSNGPWAQASQKAIFQKADVATELTGAQTKADQLIAEAYSQVG